MQIRDYFYLIYFSTWFPFILKSMFGDKYLFESALPTDYGRQILRIYKV